jgi:hypothetical protein
MTFAFTPTPHMREVMADAADSRREIVVRKHSAVGRTEMGFSEEVMAGFRAEAKRLMAEGPRPQRLADAIKKINQGKL